MPWREERSRTPVAGQFGWSVELPGSRFDDEAFLGACGPQLPSGGGTPRAGRTDMDRGRGAEDGGRVKMTDAAHAPDHGVPWGDEAPTRPVHPPRAQGGLNQQNTGDAPAAPTNTHPSARPSGAPQSSDVDRWYESIRPPSPSLPELILEPRESSARRRLPGLIAMTVVVGASLCIVVAAAVVRMRAQVPSPWLSYATPGRARVALSVASPSSGGAPSTAQAPETPAAQTPARPPSSQPAIVPSAPRRPQVQAQKAKHPPASG